MSCHPRVTAWTQLIHAHLPHVRKPQATVLALWSLGMVLARDGVGAQRRLSWLCAPGGLGGHPRYRHTRLTAGVVARATPGAPGVARGRSLSWPIGACTPAGCFGGSPACTGTRLCASTQAGHFGSRARCVGSLCRHWCPSRGRRGRGQGSSSQDAIGNAIVPSWLGGRRGIGIRG